MASGGLRGRKARMKVFLTRASLQTSRIKMKNGLAGREREKEDRVKFPPFYYVSSKGCMLSLAPIIVHGS